ncbi:ABC transporter permease [Flavivirga aquimarina]|uniref:ABC transporter permease n=1 Tax=Flavivirga aquimarina TaxID=2027862 RepID=A0ABT8WCH5_9FLAO|nr:ABC transporter permease [Flavivirga aquimarina]MDO5970849.1 ABC transporter permease [Flavivirga aquimarina]
MKSHIINTIIRNLVKKKFLSLTKILGLIIGYSIFMFLVVKIQHETNYDQFWNHSESVYRVALDLKYENGEQVKSAKNFHGASELLNLELPEILNHCNFNKDVVTIFSGSTQKIQDVDFVFSDPSFFDVFERKIIKSENTGVLKNIHGVVISQSFAHKLFGNENPLNKEITVNEGWKFVVDAVFEDIPDNSHLKIDVVATYKSLFYYMRNFDNTRQILIDNPNFTYKQPDPYTVRRWRTPVAYRPYCYIKLKEGTNINTVESKVAALLTKVPLPQNLKDSNMAFNFQPIKDIHLKSNLDHEISANGNTKQVLFLSIIIFVVLFVCAINFISLNTISNLELLKNYAIRLFSGATYTQIFQLMFVESFLINALSLLISLPIAYALITTQLPAHTIDLSILLYVVFVLILIAFSAALIPFLSVVKNRFTSGLKIVGQKINQNWRGQKLMVTAQFSITIILIVCTIGIYKQMQFMMQTDLGFNGKQTLFSFSPMTMNQHPDIPVKLSTFRNELLTLKGVNSFSTSSSIPGQTTPRLNNQVKAVHTAGPFPATFNEVSIDDAYLKTYNIKLIAGENLSFQNDWVSNDILINQTAAKDMGFLSANNAIGNRVTLGKHDCTIRGVIEDYHHTSLHNAIKPTIYAQNIRWDHSVGYYSFQLNSDNVTGTISQITQIWNRLYPKEEFIYNFSEASFASQYESDQKFNQILTYSACLALLVSCLGLLGLTLFNIKKRLKEISIRKVSGASVKQIIIMLNIDFIKWVLVAFVISIPISWYAINTWLEDFAYRTSIDWWIFGIAGFASILIALTTISWQSFKAATSNPVKALKEE